MPRKNPRSPAELPQSSDLWFIAIAQLHLWITPPNVAPHRPYLIFIISHETGAILASEMTEAEPTFDDVRQSLLNAMQSPPRAVAKPSQPKGIVVTSESLGKSFIQFFSESNLQIETYQSEMPDEINEMVRELEAHMRGAPELPGLLASKGVTPDLLRGFYAAAADYYRAAPWVPLANIHVLALRHPAERSARFVVVMGNGGVEYGLSVYRRWADVERIFGGDAPPLQLMPPDGAHSLSFEPIENVPFDDLDAIQQHGFEIASDDAYPVAITVNNQGEVARPQRADLMWYEAALRAIPVLVSDHLKSDKRGDFEPFDVTLSVPTHTGDVQMQAKYPAGDLHLMQQPPTHTDWSEGDAEGDALSFDRRAMEGMMAQLARDLGALTGARDPKLEQAQQLMYRAWEETNPAKRLALAHDALAASPDCADAYVLLAEEEAPTIEKAVEYYRKGIAAGERALGKEYFAEYVGDFWGLLETRPYMRARMGLAHMLWKLQQFDEALAHFSELLRLNPNDNQGVRYELLNLLMFLERDADVGQLLAQYEDEYSAAWLYSRALYEFRRSDASVAANAALREALKQNKHVPPYLAGAKRIPPSLPQTMGFGDENEAISYAVDHLSVWRRTSGAVEWLKAQPSAKGSPTRKRAPRKGGRRAK